MGYSDQARFECDECKKVEVINAANQEEALVTMEEWVVVSKAINSPFGETESWHYCSGACARRAFGG